MIIFKEGLIDPPFLFMNQFQKSQSIKILSSYNDIIKGGPGSGPHHKLGVNEFEKHLEEKYNIKLSLKGKGEYFTLSQIVIPKENRGNGIGSKVMDEILDYADNNNKTIFLTPSTDFGASSVSRLTKFYKTFGFIENKGKNKDYSSKESMLRLPR